MRRFDYDENEEFRDDVDRFFQENEDFFTDDESLQNSIDFVNHDFNLRIVRTTIRMLEKSFWWKFYSLNTRLKMIEKTFKRIKKTIQDE
jgi:hypothetical protein